MFSFFKRDKKAVVEPEIVQKSPEEIEHIQQQFADKQRQLSAELTAQDLNETLIAKLHEEMGLLISDIDKDEAINQLEMSLSRKLTIGDGYKKLMSLYNAKRAEAARNGDGDGIDKWMNKMDDMRQIAKKVIITG